MSVTRLGYMHARVTDLAEAKRHYCDTLGLRITLEEPGKLYLKAWDEFDHHSVVLEEGGVGMVKMGYKVETDEDLSTYENAAREFGCVTERMTKGENPEVGDGVRIVLPSGHLLELYSQMTCIGTDVGIHNPEVFPRHLVGVGVPRVDHCLLTTSDVQTTERFFIEALGFYPTERLQTTLEDDAHLIGTWLSTSNTVHDIAFIEGPDNKLHHWAFELGDWSAIGRAGSIFAMDDVSVDVGPTQHGITRGGTIYFFDPAGNRNEVFSGGYVAYRDRPAVTWTVDDLAKGIFYVQREVNERFTSVLT
ncbi:MAG TPA: catechol 2,3-dioxygenase [Sporichthya sp.]|jgi:catechol 2,3-dioxygenase|nr:catechol 2,3-dioxygenase [Sporichthya sp.]